MPLLRWLASAPASCYHAAAAVAAGEPLVDAGLADAIAPHVQALVEALPPLPGGAEQFLDHAAPLSAGLESPRQTARVALLKSAGSQPDAVADRVADCLAQLLAAFLTAVPGLIDQLELRSEPLRQQWEARGPGFIAESIRLTEPGLLPEQADVILVHPACGGGGRAHLAYNSVRMEAVLAHPLPELPETVRLGWLLLQLNADLPGYQGEVHRGRLPLAAGLAAAVTALEAAAQVELAPCDLPTLARAIEHWRPGGWAKSCEPQVTAEIVWNWWQTYSSARPDWRVALAALDRMLRGDSG